MTHPLMQLIPTNRNTRIDNERRLSEENMMADRYPPIVLRTAKVFSWTALSFGFLLIVMVIYAMVFAYR